MSSFDPSQIAELEHFAHIQHVDESVFLALQVAGGQILLPVLLVTVILMRKTLRHPVFINFCVSWIFSSILYSLLTSCTNLALIINLWIIIRSYKKTGECQADIWSLKHIIPLVATPFVAFASFAIATAVTGNAPAIDPMTGDIAASNLAVPGVFYCVLVQNDNSVSITSGLALLRSVYIFSASTSLIGLGFEVAVASMILRKLDFFRKSSSLNLGGIFVRVVLFSLYRMVVLALNFAIILNPDEIFLTGISRDAIFNGAIDFVQASIPLAAFLIFGTEKDIIRTWCFWKRRAAPLDDMEARGKEEEQSSSASSRFSV